MLVLSRTGKVSANIRRRARTMRGKKLAPAEFRIVPAEPDRAIRIVRFHLDQDGEVFSECFNESTHEECPASAHARICAHVNKAITMLLQSDRKQVDNGSS